MSFREKWNEFWKDGDAPAIAISIDTDEKPKMDVTLFQLMQENKRLKQERREQLEERKMKVIDVDYKLLEEKQ